MLDVQGRINTDSQQGSRNYPTWMNSCAKKNKPSCTQFLTVSFLEWSSWLKLSMEAWVHRPLAGEYLGHSVHACLA